MNLQFEYLSEWPLCQMHKAVQLLSLNDPWLQKLNLSKGSIDDNHCADLMSSLAISTHLLALELDSNFFGDKGWAALAAVLPLNRTLRSLALSGNARYTMCAGISESEERQHLATLQSMYPPLRTCGGEWGTPRCPRM